jgi:hypothetical protein
MSVLPPGAKPTTKVIGPLGQTWALACDIKNELSNTLRIEKRFFIEPSVL